MKQNLLVLFLILSAVFFTPILHAEEQAAAPAAPADEAANAGDIETEFSFGTVKSIGENQIVVSEYDYESNADVDVTYQVSADAEFENVGSLKEIAVGDSVDVDYLAQDGAKKAVAITVEKPLPEEEAALPDEADAPAPKE